MANSMASGGLSNTMPVGSVIHSMLTEAQFQAQMGVGWVLMDGRSVSGSRYHQITNNSTLPDARGQFLRGKNNGRADGKENPDGDSALGTQQQDAFQGHEHHIPVANVHDTASIPEGQSGYNTGYNTDGIVSDGINGTPRVSSETRPKNITVNIFIRIN